MQGQWHAIDQQTIIQLAYVGPEALTAAMRFSGIPHKPKPPTSKVFPLLISSTAAAAEG